MGKISGACFLRATFIAHEVSQKYPRVPVIKAWLYGSMMSQSDKWPYHVAPLVPVQSNGAVQWMVLDTLLASSGPVSLEEWVELTHQEHSFTSEVKLFFSAADRVGAAFNITLEQLLYTQYGTTWEQALFEAEAQAD